MELKYTDSELTDAKISDRIRQFENEKEEQLIQLIVEILVMSTLKDYHEESDQIFEVQ